MFVGRPCGFSFKERRFRRVIFGVAWCLGSRPYYVAVVIPFPKVRGRISLWNTQRLMEIGEKLGLAGKELRDFIHSEQEAARAERQIEREATREDAIRVAAAEEAERVATREDAIRVAAAEEAERVASREDAIRVAAAEEAARNIAREETAIQHERDMFKMQLEADQLREREANLSNSRADNTRGVRVQGHTPMMPGLCDDGKEDIDV